MDIIDSFLIALLILAGIVLFAALMAFILGFGIIVAVLLVVVGIVIALYNSIVSIVNLFRYLVCKDKPIDYISLRSLISI